MKKHLFATPREACTPPKLLTVIAVARSENHAAKEPNI